MRRVQREAGTGILGWTSVGSTGSPTRATLWRRKFGGMSVSDAKRLKELEIENTRLKKLLAESLL